MSAEKVSRESPAARSGLASEASDTELARLAKALGHPVRIRILRLLLDKSSCIGCDIVDEVQLAQSTVSEHLRILKAAGVILGEIEHPRVCYSLNPDRLAPLAALLEFLADRRPQDGLRAGFRSGKTSPTTASRTAR